MTNAYNFEDLRHQLATSWIGVDQLFTDTTLGLLRSTPSYPHYDVIKEADGQYLVSIAVAGFTKGDLKVTVEKTQLVVTGAIVNKKEAVADYVHHGIARRDFTLTFVLESHLEVTGAELHNGLLNIRITRYAPEEAPARKIDIQVS